MEKLQKHEESQPGPTERFMSVCWGIWKERNIASTGGLCKLGRVTLRNSVGLMEEYQMANDGPTKS